ncbi:MAG: glycosyltransferase family 4 protein, partial [Gemmatimonadetes bacterium]|nr:glycosyltransferase family 4 protein [Gemmatimonadota bacterium]
EPELGAVPVIDALDADVADLVTHIRREVPAERVAHAVHLTALGTGLVGGAPSFTVYRNAGIAFLEDTAFDAATTRRARGYDLLVAGSRWNAELLASLGGPPVACVWQGVDPLVFQPRPRSQRFADRFVVFSGGKLEYRKGQDLVVAAFRIFQARHPEALLVTAWHNLWPETMRGLDAMGHVRGLPDVTAGRLDVTGWLVDNGIPAEAVHDLGVVTPAETAHALRACDVALFPNRAEGGTNLVAMEAMACGVPAIVAANTGQRDLLTPGGAIALERQGAVRAVAPYRGTAAWGESDLDEIVAALELAWADRDAARARGLAGAAHVGAWTWTRQVNALLDVVLD